MIGGKELQRTRSCALLIATVGSLAASAGLEPLASQTVPVIQNIRDSVGVERGSTAMIGQVDKDTYFLTFDTFGAEDIGPSIASAAAAVPGIVLQGDQFDSVVVLGGPFETGEREVLALGLGYRLKSSATGPTFFINGDYADVELGSPESKALGLRGANWNLNVGARQNWALSPSSNVGAELSFTAREWKGEALGTEVLDEDLRILRARLTYSAMSPTGVSTRLGAILYKGLPGLGASPSNNPMASLRGASSDFFTASFSADLAMPLSPQFVFSAGAIGQWSDSSLPFSQRCGYGTNEFSRAFDRAFVNGDNCLGVRGEIAYNVPASILFGLSISLLQLFAAADTGKLWNVGGGGVPASDDTWGSVYGGLRILTAKTISEISLSRIVDGVQGPIEQDTVRLWFRSAVRF